MERKTRYEVHELFVVEVWLTDGSREFITGEQLRIWYWGIKLKGTVKPEKLEFNEAVQEAIYKVRQGEILMS